MFEVDSSNIVDIALKLVAQQIPLSSDVEPLLAFLTMARGVSCGILILFEQREGRGPRYRWIQFLVWLLTASLTPDFFLSAKKVSISLKCKHKIWHFFPSSPEILSRLLIGLSVIMAKALGFHSKSTCWVVWPHWSQWIYNYWNCWTMIVYNQNGIGCLHKLQKSLLSGTMESSNWPSCS